MTKRWVIFYIYVGGVYIEEGKKYKVQSTNLKTDPFLKL